MSRAGTYSFSKGFAIILSKIETVNSYYTRYDFVN